MILLLTIINSLSFIIYGLLCLCVDHMEEEFKRYKLSKFRSLTGALELLAGLGHIFGYFYSDLLYIITSVGLALLMTIGFGVRLKVSDPLYKTLPALILGAINYYLAYIKLFNF